MKKRVLAMVLALGMTFGLAGCAGSDKAADTSDKKESTDTESKDELTTVKWNYGSSGNVLVTIAEEEGYFEDEGINIELILTPGADKVAAAVLSKDVDVGFCGPEAPAG